MQVEVHGFCDAAFDSVREAFIKNFRLDLELGAAFAVAVDGEYVVDLWAGHADQARRTPWLENTIVPVASSTKVPCTLCGLMLLDQGLIELDAPVAKYWPEFAAAGKEDLPVRYVFNHTAGLAALDEPLTADLILDWDRITSAIAAQRPLWAPGTQSGYHGWTYGFIVGELVRRTTGLSPNTFFRERVATPIDADFHMGLPPSERPRVSGVFVNESGERLLEPGSLAYRAMTVEGVAPFVLASEPRWQQAESPGNNGIGNARSLAKIGSLLANGGELNGHRLLSEETVRLSYQEQDYSHDLVMAAPVRRGLGFGLSSKEIPIPYDNAFHWGGFGGSTVVMIPERRAAAAYVMNLFDNSLYGDGRGQRLNAAMIGALMALGEAS